MSPFFSTLVLVVTILAAFMTGIAISRRLVSVVLHLMMMGRLRHKQVAVPAVAAAVLNTVESH
jgi:hypothetical protein